MITNRDPVAYEYRTNTNSFGENLVLKASCPSPLICACCTECCQITSNGQEECTLQ
jgi:hypothetical protein